MAGRIARDRGQRVAPFASARRVPGQLRTAPSCLPRRARRRRRRNCTPATPMSSAAVAVTVTVRAHAARRGRTVTVTVGAVVSLVTVTRDRGGRRLMAGRIARDRGQHVACRSPARVVFQDSFVGRGRVFRAERRRRRAGTARRRRRCRPRPSPATVTVPLTRAAAAGPSPSTVGAVVSLVTVTRDRGRRRLMARRIARDRGQHVAAVGQGVVFQATSYGAVVSSAPSATPSTQELHAGDGDVVGGGRRDRHRAAHRRSPRPDSSPSTVGAVVSLVTVT